MKHLIKNLLLTILLLTGLVACVTSQEKQVINHDRVINNQVMKRLAPDRN